MDDEEKESFTLTVTQLPGLPPLVLTSRRKVLQATEVFPASERFCVPGSVWFEPLHPLPPSGAKKKSESKREEDDERL